MNRAKEEIKFTKLEKSVEDVLSENDLEAVLHFSKIFKHWSVIVGESLAGKTSPASLKKKTLIVMVEDAAYSHHLKYFEKNIIDLIASPEICGPGIVKKVVFHVGKQSIMKQQDQKKVEKQGKVKQTALPIDEEAVKTAETIKDKSLSNSFKRFMSKRLTDKPEHK